MTQAKACGYLPPRHARRFGNPHLTARVTEGCHDA